MRVLIVVDMQNDFITGSLGSPEAQAIVPVMTERLREYEDGNTLVLFTKDTHYSDYLITQEGSNLPVEHCIKGTPGWSIVKEISSFVDHGNFMTYSAKDIIKGRVCKESFGSIRLAEIVENIAANEGVEEIVMMGVCTDVCVVSNALMLKAYCPEIKITVDASCCAGVTPEKHQAALETMKSCQINVIGE